MTVLNRLIDGGTVCLTENPISGSKCKSTSFDPYFDSLPSAIRAGKRGKLLPLFVLSFSGAMDRPERKARGLEGKGMRKLLL